MRYRSVIYLLLYSSNELFDERLISVLSHALSINLFSLFLTLAFSLTPFLVWRNRALLPLPLMSWALGRQSENKRRIKVHRQLSAAI